MSRVRSRLGLFAVFCVLCQFGFAQQQYAVSNIPSDLQNNANSTIQEEILTIDIPKVNKIVFNLRRVITVYNKAGNNHLDTYVYYDNDSRIKTISATVLDKNGEEIKSFKKKDFIDRSAVSSGTLYSDNRLMVLGYRPTQYPYTVIFEYQKEGRDTFFVPTWFLQTNTYSSILSKKLQINTAPGLEVRIKEFDPEELISFSRSGNTISLAAENISELRLEELGPGYGKLVPNVSFGLNKFSVSGIQGQGQNWQDLGLWQYNNLVKDLDAIPATLQQEITTLVSGATTTKEKVKRIYEYVQNNTRYISVQLGIGGLRPYPAQEVAQVGYGDCKGLTNLTKALLTSQGIDSNYCIVYGGREKRSIDPEFASFQGNHVILNVPLESEDIWLECTSQTLPFNFLGDFTDDRDVVALTPQGGVVLHTPHYDYKANSLETSGTTKLFDDGSINAQVTMVSKGIQYDNRFTSERMNTEDRTGRYKAYWDYIDNVTINSMEFNNDKQNIVFTEDINFSATSYGSIADNKMLVPVNVLNRYTYYPDRYKDRTQDIVVERGYTDTDSFTLEIPENYQVDTLPSAVEIDNEFGKYAMEVVESGENQLRITRTFVLYEVNLDKSRFKDYRTFLRTIVRSDAQKMILTKR